MRVGVIHYNSHAIFDKLEFFTPGCKLCELSISHLFRWTMIQYKFQIFVNVQVVCLCHFNHCIDYSTGIGSFYRITEQPVFAANCKRTDRVLAEIVCETTVTILQIGLRCFPPVKDIIHRFIHAGISDWLLLLKPRPESLQNRFFLLETQLLTFFIITGIFFVNGIFYGKQAVTVLDSLYCWLAVIILFPFGNGVDKVPADVCPTGTSFDIRQAVVALVTIRFQISVIAFQKLLCMAATPGWRIAI